MKRNFLLLMLAIVFGLLIQAQLPSSSRNKRTPNPQNQPVIPAQRISASSCSVTVYTDNGAYVKAFSKNSHTVNVKLTYTEQVLQNGDTTNYKYTYSFSIAANEEKQLFFSSNKVIALDISSCKEEGAYTSANLLRNIGEEAGSL